MERPLGSSFEDLGGRFCVHGVVMAAKKTAKKPAKKTPKTVGPVEKPVDELPVEEVQLAPPGMQTGEPLPTVTDSVGPIPVPMPSPDELKALCEQSLRAALEKSMVTVKAYIEAELQKMVKAAVESARQASANHPQSPETVEKVSVPKGSQLKAGRNVCIEGGTVRAM